MPLTQLDKNAALVIIDLQKGIVARPELPQIGSVIERSARLARAFQAKKFPVALVNVAAAAPGRTDMQRMPQACPADWMELIPELERQATDIVVTKRRSGAFIGTSLQDSLQQGNVTQIFLTGVATSSGVEATARSAYDLGYHVVFTKDAMSDPDPNIHEHCVTKIFPRIGETASTQDILTLLER